MLAALNASSWWTYPSDHAAFADAYAALPASVMGEVDISQWQDAAALLVPLCRGNPTAQFELPSIIFNGNMLLPGYTQVRHANRVTLRAGGVHIV